LTESPDSARCRIGLRGSPTFVDRAASALANSGIEVASRESNGRLPANAEPQTGLDVLVIFNPELADEGISRLEGLCASGSCPVVVVTTAIDKGVILAMLRAGARGIVLTDEVESALAPAVLAARAGQVAIPRPARHQVFRPVLSHRENTVLAMVALGRSNAQIANSLHLEESTVKSHLRSLFAKLGVSTREEAAAAVFDGDSQVVSGVMAVTAEHQRPKKAGKPRRAKAASKRPVSS
jgi:DNA-binding NarL/FixJ family response regulator